MPQTAHRQEIEIKLRVQDIHAVRDRLKRLGAREIAARTYESNLLYDTSKQDLRRRGRLVRVRIEQPPSRFGKKGAKKSTAGILTYKGPPLLSRNPTKTTRRPILRRRYKVREEAEVVVSSADELARILRALGLHPAFQYEKFRTTYGLPGLRRLKIELDETPIGDFLELEGNVAEIDRGARLLGYGPGDYLTASYGALYLAACRRDGRKPGDMLFPPIKKLRSHALFP
jgi:adenylate cyclase class 2